MTKGGRGESQKVTKDDGGVWKPPKLADIICEQPRNIMFHTRCGEEITMWFESMWSLLTFFPIPSFLRSFCWNLLFLSYFCYSSSFWPSRIQNSKHSWTLSFSDLQFTSMNNSKEEVEVCARLRCIGKVWPIMDCSQISLSIHLFRWKENLFLPNNIF